MRINNQAMCGITGYLGFDSADQATLGNMIAAMRHRGPDSSGQWTNQSQEIALGHSRLSIVELSEAGAQPMISLSGRYVLTYNGEIYNHLDLRKQLTDSGNAPIWRGHSDTETLLAGFDNWGVVECLKKCIGMFAIAVWDMSSCTLTLLRDRFGEKPLYYQPTPGGVIFSSELASLRKHPLSSDTIYKPAIRQLVESNCIRAPLSIYKGVFKLLPGTAIKFNIAGFIETNEWWSPLKSAFSNYDTWEGSEQEASIELENRLVKAVGQQMLADVPLGAFLSGGIDSSLIVALMQRNSCSPVKTFTIGFEQQSFNEAKYARKVAAHLGTEHHEHYVSNQDIKDLIPRVSSIFSEPFADSSQLPTYLVSEVARRQATVVLTGDAGDEIFAGYNRHVFAHNHWHNIQKVPHALRVLVANAVQAPPEALLDRIFGLIPLASQWTRPGEKLKRSSYAVSARSVPELYRMFTRATSSNQILALPHENEKIYGPQSELIDKATKFSDKCVSHFDAMRWLMVKDQTDYLPNDILAKVDRAAMACSLETRAPFLDHTLVEFTQKLPSSFLVDGNAGKKMLRKILGGYIPTELFDRPKMGFSIPVGNMLTGPLKDWAAAHLCRDAIKSTDAFDAEIIENLWHEHLSGKQDHILKLWPVLMYQAWHENAG